MIRSPEQVELHLPLAGPTSRILAYAIDAGLVLAIEIGLIVLWAFAFPEVLSRLTQAIAPAQPRADRQYITPFFWGIVVVVMATVEFLYFLFWETVGRGRSPGKRALRLQVVTEEGFPVDVRRALVRNLLRTVDMLPFSYVVGLAAMIASRRTQRLGDLAAGTLVVRLDRPAPAAPLDEDPLPGDPVFRFTPTQLARIGQVELMLARQTLRRVETLPPEQAAPILERSVEALRTRLDYATVAHAERPAFLRALLAAARLR